MKLLKSTQRYFSRNENNSNGSVKGITNHMGVQQANTIITSNNVDMSHGSSPSLWNPPPVMNNGMIHIGPSKGMINVGPSNVVDFSMPPTQIMVSIHKVLIRNC